MNVFAPIRNYLRSLEYKEAASYTALTGVAIGALFGLLVYNHLSRVSRWHTKFETINKDRKKAASLLQRHAVVNEQQHAVETILSKDPNFRIKEFFTEVVAETGLSSANSKPAELSEPQDLRNGYSEVKLVAGFSGISMRQLCEFLYKIEQNERVFTREIDITKSPKMAAINVVITIATLQAKEGT